MAVKRDHCSSLFHVLTSQFVFKFGSQFQIRRFDVRIPAASQRLATVANVRKLNAEPGTEHEHELSIEHPET